MESNTLVIRPLQADDFNTVENLYGLIQDLHYVARPEIFPQTEPALTPEHYAELLEKPGCLALAADWGGETAGFLYAYWKFAPDSPYYCPRRVLYIDDVAVLPAYQHRGIARALIDAARAHAEQNRADALELRVWAFNAYARKIYEQFGMQEQYCIMELPLGGGR